MNDVVNYVIQAEAADSEDEYTIFDTTGGLNDKELRKFHESKFTDKVKKVDKEIKKAKNDNEGPEAITNYLIDAQPMMSEQSSPSGKVYDSSKQMSPSKMPPNNRKKSSIVSEISRVLG